MNHHIITTMYRISDLEWLLLQMVTYYILKPLLSGVPTLFSPIKMGTVFVILLRLILARLVQINNMVVSWFIRPVFFPRVSLYYKQLIMDI